MPQPTAVMQVEGVLRKPVAGAVIDSGRRLYLGLSQFYRIVLVTEETDHEHIGHWLGMEGFARHDHVVYGDVPTSPHWPRWVSLARTLKISYGYDVDVIVLPDPADAVPLIESGHNVLLFTQASYALPEWRPDHLQGIRPWAELTGEIHKGQALRAADKRTEERDAR